MKPIDHLEDAKRLTQHTIDHWRTIEAATLSLGQPTTQSLAGKGGRHS